MLTGKICELVCDTAHLPLAKIQEVLSSWDAIKDYLYILHDKCKKVDGSLKNPHYHVYLRFYKTQRFDTVAQKFGVSPAFVSKIHGRFADALAYATHKNAPDKHQYDVSECVSNFDFGTEIKQNEERKEGIQELEKILEGIDKGDIKEYNVSMKVSLKSYVKYYSQIQRAFEFKLSQKRMEVSRDMQVFYIYGSSGLGKTTLAKMFAQKQGYAPFVSSSSNDPFDGYQGQEAIILDDIRGSSFTFSDLLKILDPNTQSTVKKRYKNIVLGSDVIFLTSIKTPDELYTSLFESDGEEVLQFYRRFSQFIKVTEDYLYVYAYDADHKQLVSVATLPNPVKKLRMSKKFDKAKEHEKALALFDFTDADLQAVSVVADTVETTEQKLMKKAILGDLSDFAEISE